MWPKKYVDTYSLADAAAEDPRKEGKTFHGYSNKPNNRMWRSSKSVPPIKSRLTFIVTECYYEDEIVRLIFGRFGLSK